MIIAFCLPLVLLGLFAFMATSTPKDYKCPNRHDARIAFNGYGVCDNCGWSEYEGQDLL